MGHIVANDWYLVDYDGQPTTWGRWNPKYVNGFPSEVGDRKLNSSNIIAMLQTAHHFTDKEIYKEKAFELMDDNANRCVLDGGNGGVSEYSAGDIWLLPYWMGRYLGVIGEPDL